MLSFVSVDKNLINKIRSNENHLFSKYLTQKAAASMFLESSRPNEVYNIVHSSYPEKKYVEKKKNVQTAEQKCYPLNDYVHCSANE